LFGYKIILLKQYFNKKIQFFLNSPEYHSWSLHIFQFSVNFRSSYYKTEQEQKSEEESALFRRRNYYFELFKKKKETESVT